MGATQVEVTSDPPSPPEPALPEPALPAPALPAPTTTEIHGEPAALDRAVPATLDPDPLDPTAPMRVGEPAPPAPTIVEPAPSKAPRRLAIALAILTALGVGALLGLDPLARWVVRREALRFGMEVEYERITLGMKQIRIHGAHVRLQGVSSVSVEIAEVGASLDGLTATSIEALGLALALEGSAVDRLIELGAWSNDHAAFFRLPGTSTDVRITWVASRGEAPWLDLTRGTLSSSGTGAVFRTPSASLLGVPVGALAAAWTASDGSLAVGLGKEAIPDAPIRLDLHPTATPPTAELTIKPLTLESLGAPLGLALPAPGATVEGNATLTLGGGKKGAEVIDGSVTMTLIGWTPPHPRELDGIVYGNRTSFTTKVQVSGDRRKATLSETAVTAGAFKLKGGGTVDRADDHALAKLDLKGNLACSEVARSAAIGNLGSFLGKLLGDVAQTTVSGSVAVSVHLEADTRDLKGAKIKQEVGVGCGLRLPKVF